MKYATKIPYVPPGRETLFSNKLGELDGEMKRILERRDLLDFEKIKLYNQVLTRFLSLNSNFRDKDVALDEVKKEKKVLKRKPSNYFITKPKKFCPEEEENTVTSDDYDDDDDDMHTAKDGDFSDSELWANFASSEPVNIDVNQMNTINRAVMKKSSSNLSKYIKKIDDKQEKREQNRSNIISKLNWTNF